MHDQGTFRSINAKQSDSYLNAQAEITARKLAAAKKAQFESSLLGRLVAWWNSL